jgi:hypothetical protein
LRYVGGSVVGVPELVATRDMRTWYAGLNARDRSSIRPVIEALGVFGDELHTKFRKPIKSSRHREMHELLSLAGNIRVLYAIDQKRDRAVLLLGGDKTGNWQGWYRDTVPKADRLLDAYKGREGGEGPWRTGPNLGR